MLKLTALLTRPLVLARGIKPVMLKRDREPRGNTECGSRANTAERERIKKKVYFSNKLILIIYTEKCIRLYTIRFIWIESFCFFNMQSHGEITRHISAYISV